MSPRLAYILRQSFRNKFGVWPSDEEVRAWVAYLARIKIEIEEKV